MSWVPVQLFQGNTVIGTADVKIQKLGSSIIFHIRNTVKCGSVAGVNATIVSSIGAIPLDCRPKTAFSVQQPTWTINNNVPSLGTFYVGGGGQFGFCPRDPNSVFGLTANNGIYPVNTTWNLD